MRVTLPPVALTALTTLTAANTAITTLAAANTALAAAQPAALTAAAQPAAQRGARCVPRVLPELAAVVPAEKQQLQEPVVLPGAQLQVRLHADERGRLHRREQLRDRVHGQRPRWLLR